MTFLIHLINKQEFDSLRKEIPRGIQYSKCPRLNILQNIDVSTN